MMAEIVSRLEDMFRVLWRDELIVGEKQGAVGQKQEAGGKE